MVSAVFSHKKIDGEDNTRIDWSNIYFSGDREIIKDLYQITDYIEYEHIIDVQNKLDRLAQEKTINWKDYLAGKEEIKRYKKEHLLWMFSKKRRADISEMMGSCELLQAHNKEIYDDIDKLREERLVNLAEKSKKLQSMLMDLGFDCISSIESDDELLSEYYECSLSDEELSERVYGMLTEMRERQEQKQEDTSTASADNSEMEHDK